MPRYINAYPSKGNCLATRSADHTIEGKKSVHRSIGGIHATCRDDSAALVAGHGLESHEGRETTRTATRVPVRSRAAALLQQHSRQRDAVYLVRKLPQSTAGRGRVRGLGRPHVQTLAVLLRASPGSPCSCFIPLQSDLTILVQLIANSWAVRSLLIWARCSHQRTKRVRMARATRARNPPPLSYSVASLLPTSFGQVNNPPHETSFLSTVRHSRWTRRFTCGTGETDANGTTYTCVYCPMVTLVNSTRLVALGTCTPSGCPGCNGIHLRQGIAVLPRFSRPCCSACGRPWLIDRRLHPQDGRHLWVQPVLLSVSRHRTMAARRGARSAEWCSLQTTPGVLAGRCDASAQTPPLPTPNHSRIHTLNAPPSRPGGL